jgi:hypothetical protein
MIVVDTFCRSSQVAGEIVSTPHLLWEERLSQTGSGGMSFGWSCSLFTSGRSVSHSLYSVRTGSGLTTDMENLPSSPELGSKPKLIGSYTGLVQLQERFLHGQCWEFFAGAPIK